MVPHTLSTATALKARNYGSAAPASVLPAGVGVPGMIRTPPFALRMVTLLRANQNTSPSSPGLMGYVSNSHPRSR